MKEGRHLDLGCGSKPRNPYGLKKLSGIDLYKSEALAPEVDFKKANLTLDPIPYEDNQFDSISAFDFIEHIPRVMQNAVDSTRFPFIELMNEVWRVLKPNGVFYALTPAFPRPEVFQDPTHVNIITDTTHEYFCGAEGYAKNYGFKGNFEVVRAKWIHPKNAFTAEETLKKSIRNLTRAILLKGQKSHFLWELRAIK